MTVVAQDILTVANSICGINSEAGYRSAISRAYYSVYHGCIEWEKSFPAPGSSDGAGGGVHQQLINRLRNPAPEIKDSATKDLSRKIAARVEALKTKRKAADYFLSAAGHTQADAMNSCAQAHDVLQRIGGAIGQQGGATAPATSPDPAQQKVDAPVPDKDPDPLTPVASQRPSLRRVH